MNDSTNNSLPVLVSVVIPIYNMEQHLRKCLDSVVNQTLREIEILCVNDGSTDGSLAIIEEYAAKDNRIKVINKENGGLGSARNAAYPHLRGKYTYIADADDWLYPDLCRRTYYCAEAHQSDITFVFFTDGKSQKVLGPVGRSLYYDNPTPEDRKFFLTRLSGATYTKLSRTEFILDHSMTYPYHRVGQDQLIHWKACLYSERVSICPEALYYYYRDNPTSATNRRGEMKLDVFLVWDEIKHFLAREDFYELYRDAFLAQKMDHIYFQYRRTNRLTQATFRKRIRETFGDDERRFLVEGNLHAPVRQFFRGTLGHLSAKFRYNAWHFRERLLPYLGIRRIKDKLKQMAIARFATALRLRDDALCETLASLREENVRLKEKVSR